MRLPRLRPAWRVLPAVLALLLAGCEKGVLAPVGVVGREQRTILFDALAIMLAIVIPTIAAVFYVAWRFRASNRNAPYLPSWSYSGRIEVITWSIPTLVILFLAGVIWTGSRALDPAQPLRSEVPALEVQVVSLDWKWLFIYPEQRLATVNELVIPVDRPVRFSITSGSVMNGFFVPQLGGMVAAMNGMTTELNLKAEQVGEYFGLSTQFSGDGFPDMHFAVRALPDDAFSEWSATAAGADAPVLDRASYLDLARQSHDVRPFVYRLGDPALFQAIVTQAVPPGPGPVASAGHETSREPIHPQRGH